MKDNKSKLSLAELNRQKTTDKVQRAISQLKKSNATITIASVCKQAGISAKTIYTNRPDLRLLVEESKSLQSDLSTRKIERKPRGSTQNQRINRLREKNKQLSEDKQKLLEQNMLLTKQVINLQARLFDMEDKLYSQADIKIVDMKTTHGDR